MEQHTYKYLQGLLDSDYQIVDGEPNIIGWEVKSETGNYLGEVNDLLFDPQSNAVRYLIVDLDNNGMGLDDKKVMIPIGIAHLHTSDDEVVLPNVHTEQFNALPNYVDGEIGPATEVQVREIIGSPAALRLEDQTVEFDRQQFYSHQHFDRGHFYQRGGDPSRRVQQETIHNLVENSKANDHQAANQPTGTDAHHNEQHPIKPWLEPGADHNQGGTPNPDEDYLSNRPTH